MKKLIVIDGNSLAYRAFYGVPMLSNSKGVITNAVYGFLNMIHNLLANEAPDYFAVAFDVGDKVFRHEQFTEYKAGRKRMPDELRSQMPLIKEALQKMRVPIYELAGYEGDDIIGTMIKWAADEDIESIVVSGDRDNLQLINDQTKVYFTKRGISEVVVYDRAKLQEDYGLTPEQIIDLKGLMGDSSDNIPGVPSVGEKTAMKLLADYGSMENLYEHLADFAGKKLGEKLTTYREQAFMSKALATILADVPLHFDKADLVLEAPDGEALLAFYEELELRTLAKNLLAEDVSLQQDIQDGGEELPGASALGAVLAGVKVEELVLTFAAEAKTGDYQVSAICLLINGQAYRVTCHDDFALYAQLLKPYVEDPDIPLLTDDAKLFYRLMIQAGVEVENLVWDGVLSDYILDPEGKEHSVGHLLYEFHSKTLPAEEPARSFGTVHGIAALQEPVLKRLTEQNLLRLYQEIELPLTAVLARMEAQGVAVDRAYLQELEKELGERLAVLIDSIYVLAGEEFNINSPKQLGVILFERLGLPVLKKTKTGYSTDAEVLNQLSEEHGIVADILAYRQLSKLKSTYVDGLLAIVDEDNHIVHTNFKQTIAATGRLSSTEPNLQNIPVKTEEGKRIRKAFIPSKPHYVLVAADYSQIELRILADMSEDPVLLESFAQGQDVHTRTAAEVFHVPLAEVTSEMRRAAKAVNFGIIYGQTDFGLSKELGVSRQEAKDYIDKYFATYQGVRTWIDETIATTRDRGYALTMLGRQRRIKDINSKNFNLRSFAERTAVNTPIQGSAADIIKLAMLEIDYQLRANGFKAKMILQVHDELIFEVPPEELGSLVHSLRVAMEDAATLSVPLKVDVSVGFNWNEMERV